MVFLELPKGITVFTIFTARCAQLSKLPQNVIRNWNQIIRKRKKSYNDRVSMLNFEAKRKKNSLSMDIFSKTVEDKVKVK